MSTGDYLDHDNWRGKTLPLWVAPFPRNLELYSRQALLPALGCGCAVTSCFKVLSLWPLWQWTITKDCEPEPSFSLKLFLSGHLVTTEAIKKFFHSIVLFWWLHRSETWIGELLSLLIQTPFPQNIAILAWLIVRSAERAPPPCLAQHHWCENLSWRCKVYLVNWVPRSLVIITRKLTPWVIPSNFKNIQRYKQQIVLQGLSLSVETACLLPTMLEREKYPGLWLQLCL